MKSSVAPGRHALPGDRHRPPNSTQTQDLVKTLTTTAAPAGYQVHVAGEAASTYDFFNELNTWFPWVIAWVVVTSLIVFAVLLRSVVLPVLAVAVNLLTIAMSYGMLVLLFQGTTFEKILRFTSTGGIDAVIPVVILCILFGITMDYAVFMLTRTHERWNRTHDNRESVITGVTRTGRIIASAALLVVDRHRRLRVHQHQRDEDAGSWDRAGHHRRRRAHPAHVCCRPSWPTSAAPTGGGPRGDGDRHLHSEWRTGPGPDRSLSRRCACASPKARSQAPGPSATHHSEAPRPVLSHR